MKKFLLIAMMAGICALSVNAQENEKQQRPKFDRTEMIQKRTEAFAKQYGLDAKQQEELLKLNQENPMAMMFMGGRPGGPRGGFGMGPRRQGGQMGNGEVRQRPDSSGEGARMRQGRGGGRPDGGRGPRMNREAMEKYDQALQKIMTKEQYAKFDADRKSRMERMGHNRNANDGNSDSRK